MSQSAEAAKRGNEIPSPMGKQVLATGIEKRKSRQASGEDPVAADPNIATARFNFHATSFRKRERNQPAAKLDDQ